MLGWHCGRCRCWSKLSFDEDVTGLYRKIFPSKTVVLSWVSEGFDLFPLCGQSDVCSSGRPCHKLGMSTINSHRLIFQGSPRNRTMIWTKPMRPGPTTNSRCLEWDHHWQNKFSSAEDPEIRWNDECCQSSLCSTASLSLSLSWCYLGSWTTKESEFTPLHCQNHLSSAASKSLCRYKT